jgi:hypothetical protein
MGNMNNILNKIIEAEGSCTQWASPSVCKECPLSKLRQKPNGTYLSCIEALGVQNMTEEEADARYKEVAVRILLDEAIDEILGEPDVSE